MVTTPTKSITPAPPPLDPIQLEEGAKQFAAVLPPNDVFFTVWTDSKFYDTRLKFILNTWAKDLSSDVFVAVSDLKRTTNASEEGMNLPGTQVHETNCPAHTHWEGACCKWAQGVINAQNKMLENPHLKWAFFSDDDAYVRPSYVAAALRKREQAAPLALGILGCKTSIPKSTANCSGLCGGGGFALNRAAVNRLAGDDPAAFLKDQMSWCMKCNRWADQALAMIWKDRGINVGVMDGLNANRQSLPDFKKLVDTGRSLVFHFQRTEHQFQALHEIFTQERQLVNETGACIDHQGHKTCTASDDNMDTPWFLKPSLAIPNFG